MTAAYAPRLIQFPGRFDPASFRDRLVMAAWDIEEAMRVAGARPGDDYGYLDLFRMALSRFAPEPAGPRTAPARVATLAPEEDDP